MSKLTFHTLCGQSLETERRDDGEFSIISTCPAGLGGGKTTASELVNTCSGCAHSRNPLVQQPEPEPAPEPVLEQPAQATAPEGLPPAPVQAAPPVEAPPAPGNLPPMPALASAPPVQAPPPPIEVQQPVQEVMIPMPKLPDVATATPPAVGEHVEPALPTAAPPAPDMQAVTVDKRDYQTSAIEPNLPALDTLSLPSGLTISSLMEAVDIAAVLKSIEGCPFGSSEGGWSPHKLNETTCLRRFYLRHILGVQPLKRGYHFDFGTLFHACLAMRYLHGAERQYEPCEKVAEIGGADIAYDVKKLLLPMFDKYAKEEWDTWCPRAVEYNMVAWIPCQIDQKVELVPLSCRLDMVLAIKQPNEPHPGPGPVPQGVYLLDWKTTSAMTYDLISAYGMDYQFLVQCAIFKLGNYQEIFGPLRGVYVALAAKRTKPSYDDYQRIESPIDDATINDFIVYELQPTVARIHKMYMDTKVVQDRAAWTKDKRLCVGRYGPCDYFKYCDREESVGYRINQEHIVTPDFFMKAPAGYKPAEIPGLDLTKSTSKKGAKKSSTPKDKPEDNAEAGLLSSSINQQIETDETFAALRKENFLTPGHTFQTVQRALAASLKQFYLPSAESKTMWHAYEHEWKFQKTGIAWKTPDGDKGRVTWSALAGRICKDIWFNLANVMPQ